MEVAGPNGTVSDGGMEAGGSRGWEEEMLTYNTDETLQWFAVGGVAVIALVHLVYTGYLPRVVRKFFPESAIVLLVGVAAGAIIRYGTTLNFAGFDEKVFFHILLPPIILYAGYSLEEHHGHVFFSNIRSICTFAVLGTLISTVIVSLLAWATVVGGVVDLTFTECWIFGALISAIDPVSTLAIFESSHVEDDLFNLLFGESVLNDAVAIVLFRAANSFADPSYPPTATNIGKEVGMFFAVSFGSVGIGLGVGMLMTISLKYFRMPRDGLSTVIFFICGYFAYQAAEVSHLSGIISILLYGIFTGHYAKRNMSHTDALVSSKVSQILGWVMEELIFIDLGTTVLTDTIHDFNIGFIATSCCACILGRAANTFPISAGLNVLRKRKIPCKTQAVMFFSGLRGAIAYGLSLKVETANAELIQTTTLAIVIFTTIVIGGATLPLLEFMGIISPDKGDDDIPSLATQASQARRAVSRMWFLLLDRKYLLPFFVKKASLPKWGLGREGTGSDGGEEALDKSDPALDQSTWSRNSSPASLDTAEPKR